MIELSLAGEPRIICDVCRDQIADAGLAVVLRGPGAAAVFSHKGSCQGAAERFLAREGGWAELVEFLEELRLGFVVDDQAAELTAHLEDLANVLRSAEASR